MFCRLLCLFVCCCVGSIHAYEERLLALIATYVEHSDYACKEEMLAVVSSLERDHQFLETGNDTLRAKCVGLQGIIEHVIAQELGSCQIRDLVGIIHTPAPATPLCSAPPAEDVSDLIDPNSFFDTEKLLTIRSRVHVMRDYLTYGGRLYVVYPADGMRLRTSEQQGHYAAALNEFPNQLIDWPLAINEIPTDRIGALYLFTTNDGRLFAFSIKSTQAILPHDNVEWGLWLGEITDPNVQQRLADIGSYLQDVGGPNILNQAT